MNDQSAKKSKKVMMKTLAKTKFTKKPDVEPIVVQVEELPLRNSIYNKSLEDFSPNGSQSDLTKKIIITENKKKMLINKSPQDRKGEYLSMDINTETKSMFRLELFKQTEDPQEHTKLFGKQN